ncbi:MAG: hypothetical protein ACK5XS_00475 [Armatimonadota bacterium]|nr:DUF2809 domain-containing protein [Fimbriimonadaceae bacterium]MCZ8139710.1 hypothetical protein [Fimbriimonadaceae bacterium]
MACLALPRKPVVVAVCLVVGALHFVTGPGYSGPLRAFVNGYLIDLLLRMDVLLLGLGLETVSALRPAPVRAELVLAMGVVVEGCQYFGIPLFGRTFDPLDLLMYLLGVTAAVGFERLVFGAARPLPEAK